MNEIANRQNSPEYLRLMRARSQIYREAQHFQVLQLVLTVGVPVAMGLIGIFIAGARLYTGFLSVALTIFDVSWLDRQQRKKLKVAAKISEQFDTGVLELRPNSFIGRWIEPELIERASRAWRRGDAELRNWYPPSVSKAPITLGRVLCQRANLRYDRELRKRYGNILLAIASLIVMTLVAIGFANRLMYIDIVLTTVAPAAPILVWAIRERFRQIDTGVADDAMRTGVETLWDLASKHQITEEESLGQSRTLQDAIFAHRSSSPMIFPFIYDHMRPMLEGEMHAGTDDLLRRIGIS
jgi:hypothetical protein